MTRGLFTMYRPLDPDAELEPDLAADRRSPGREDEVSLELIPLLRDVRCRFAKASLSRR
jgi:hypothetical protein